MAETRSAVCLFGSHPPSTSRVASYPLSCPLYETVRHCRSSTPRLLQRISVAVFSQPRVSRKLVISRSRSYRWSDDEIEGLTTGLDGRFQEAVDLFNAGDYYAYATPYGIPHAVDLDAVCRCFFHLVIAKLMS